MQVVNQLGYQENCMLCHYGVPFGCEGCRTHVKLSEVDRPVASDLPPDAPIPADWELVDDAEPIQQEREWVPGDVGFPPGVRYAPQPGAVYKRQAKDAAARMAEKKRVNIASGEDAGYLWLNKEMFN